MYTSFRTLEASNVLPINDGQLIFIPCIVCIGLYPMISKHQTLLYSCRSEGRSQSVWRQLRINTLWQWKRYKADLQWVVVACFFFLSFFLVNWFSKYIISVAGGQYQRAVILNNGTHLCLLDIRILSHHHNYKIDCFYQHTDTSETMTYIEVNGRTREVYFATQKAIYRVPIDQQNANAVKLTATLPNNKGNGDVTGKNITSYINIDFRILKINKYTMDHMFTIGIFLHKNAYFSDWNWKTYAVWMHVIFWKIKKGAKNNGFQYSQMS